MKVHIEIDEDTLHKLICDHLTDALGELQFRSDSLRIEVKSKQNWKAEWERAAFRAIYEDNAL